MAVLGRPCENRVLSLFDGKAVATDIDLHAACPSGLVKLIAQDRDNDGEDNRDDINAITGHCRATPVVAFTAPVNGLAGEGRAPLG
jgi:hypothetical protein